jgi:hypothetical protein
MTMASAGVFPLKRDCGLDAINPFLVSQKEALIF